MTQRDRDGYLWALVILCGIVLAYLVAAATPSQRVVYSSPEASSGQIVD